MTGFKGEHRGLASVVLVTHVALLPLLRAPVIRHQAVEYLPNNRFPQIQATIESEKGIQSAKLYFRAAQHPDFYYVEMTEEAPESFRAVIPMPEKETEKVVYYIEATGNNPDTARTAWYTVKTTDQPVEAYFRGEEPGIVVGKVSATSPDMPPGFQTAGIVGFIGAAGAAIAVGAAGGGGAGAGIGAGTAVLVGAAVGAGAGGVAVLATESDSGTDNPLRACFTTIPDPAIIEEDESITLDGRCSEPGDAITSYRWDLGDGRTREGPFIRPIYRTAGSYNVTLTISDGTQTAAVSKRLEVRPKPVETTTTTTTTVLPSQPLRACFNTTPDPPVIVEGESISFDGRCSTPVESITAYEWDFGDGRPGKEGRVVQHCYLEPGTFTAILTVTNRAGLQDQTSKDVAIQSQPTTTSTTSSTSTTSTTSTTTTTTSVIPNTADMAIGPLSLSPNFPLQWAIQFDVTVINVGPQNASGVRLTIDFTGPIPEGPFLISSVPLVTCTIRWIEGADCDYPGSMPAGSNWVLTFELQANSGLITATASVTSASPPDLNPGNNSASIAATQALRRADEGQITTSLISVLDAPPPNGGIQGQVILNSAQVDDTDNRVPYRHQTRGIAGENTVESYVTSGDGREGIWRFDFRGAEHFVPGSLRVELGNVVSVNPHQVVFRLAGTPGERIRFTFRLSPE